MPHYSGGPNRERYRLPTREEKAAQTRKTLRRVGVGFMAASPILAAIGLFTAIDAITHGMGQETIVGHILPLSSDAQFQLGYTGVATGGITFISGFGLRWANQES